MMDLKQFLFILEKTDSRGNMDRAECANTMSHIKKMTTNQLKTTITIDQ